MSNINGLRVNPIPDLTARNDKGQFLKGYNNSPMSSALNRATQKFHIWMSQCVTEEDFSLLWKRLREHVQQTDDPHLSLAAIIYSFDRLLGRPKAAVDMAVQDARPIDNIATSLPPEDRELVRQAYERLTARRAAISDVIVISDTEPQN